MMSSIFQVITLAWSLSGGQYLTNATAYEDYFINSNDYFAKIDFQLQIPMSFVKGDGNMVFVGASVDNRFIKAPSFWGMAPRYDEYIFNAGIRFFEIEIGFEHMCFHPVMVSSLPTDRYFMGYDKVYFEITGKL